MFFLIVVSCNIEFDKDTAAELENATFAGDVFKILFKKEVFQPSDVMVMQFLLQETECEELGKNALNMPKSTTQCIIMKHHQVLFLNNELLIW